MAIGTIASIATIAVAAASLANMGYQASQGAPSGPNLASASRGVAEAQANALPEQRAIAAAAAQGGVGSVATAAHRGVGQMVKVPNSSGGIEENFKWVPYDAAEWQGGGKYFDYGQKLSEKGEQPTIKMRKGKIPASRTDYDFTGYGTADIEGELARQFADIKTDLGAKYGVQFAEQARKEAEMADPEGFAARQKEYDLIQNEINNPPPVSPLSGTLDEQILGQLKAHGGIDDMERGLLDDAVAKANMARSGRTSGADIEQSMTTGAEGEARRNATYDKAGAWLESGSTPEDIRYRREQQNLASLGAFTAGQTPESQFANLSGAQDGATPFVPGRSQPTLPSNAGAAGAPGAVAAYQAKLNQQGGQADSWFSGMSALLNGVATMNQVRK